MKTIYLILLFLILGIVFGFILAKVMVFLSNWLLKRKVNKQIKTDEREFFYKDKPYNLKENIEFEKSKRKKFHLFKRKQKGGISDYGNTVQPGVRRNEVYGSIQTAEYTAPSPPTSPANRPPEPRDTRKQEYTASPENRGEQGRNFNRNFLKKGKKFD